MAYKHVMCPHGQMVNAVASQAVSTRLEVPGSILGVGILYLRFQIGQYKAWELIMLGLNSLSRIHFDSFHMTDWGRQTVWHANINHVTLTL